MNIDIATASFRNAKTWRNRKITWDNFVKKMSIPFHTPETVAEYASSAKDRRDEIKDVGGFVGGYLIDGRRKPGFVKHRQLLSLDVDFARKDFWALFELMFECTGLIYSTHTHTPENPRLRLIIPIDRPVSPEEYEAIGRRVADKLGMKQFDSTTFQPFRLMYWQSTSKDGEYLFRHQDGPFLNADEILSSYVNWRDVSEWPICGNENNVIRESMAQQENPTTKRGLIGAFCRAYPITAAIEEFIPDRYKPVVGDPSRYSYADGTTSGGAQIFDDIFLYSYHNSDPVGGLLVNAFDLVRVHKFGHLDKDRDRETTMQPSYNEMISLAHKDPEVIREIGAFTLELEDTEWLKDMDATGRGVYKDTINNVQLILRNDENLRGAFAYNEFDYREYIIKPLPWDARGAHRPIHDKDEAGLRGYLERAYGIFHVSKTRDAIDTISHENRFHPVRDYLSPLIWDGRERLATMLCDTLGAENSAYVRTVTRKAMVASVARVFEPGCKYDHVIVLVGPQGIGKSRFLKGLGGKWYSDTLDDVTGKDAYEQVQGAHIIELAELSSLKKAEIESVKHFITKQSDRYRKAYGRHTSEFPRQCTFWGTTNVMDFLRDDTGNRRFWPLLVDTKFKGDLEWEQIWAEAVHYYNAGEDLFLDDKMEAVAGEMQRRHSEKDGRAGIIEKYLDTPILESNEWAKRSRFERRAFLAGEPFDVDNGKEKQLFLREYVCAAEIWVEAFGCEYRDMYPANTKFINSVLASLGWSQAGVRKFPPYGPQRCYSRPIAKTVASATNIFTGKLDFMN